MPSITAGQIQAQVSAIRKRMKNGAYAFAIRAPDGWPGPDSLQIDGVEHLLLPCASDLQAREALLRAGAVKIKALGDLNPDLKQAFVDWFARTRGESIRCMMAAIDVGYGAELIPLGLAVGLIFLPELQKQPEYHAARARLERYFGGRDID